MKCTLTSVSRPCRFLRTIWEECMMIEIGWAYFSQRRPACTMVDMESTFVDLNGNRLIQIHSQMTPISTISKEVTKISKFDFLEDLPAQTIKVNPSNVAIQSVYSNRGNEIFAATSFDTVMRTCHLVCDCFDSGDRKLQSLLIGYDLSPEQAATVFATLVDKEGSTVAMSFLHRAICHAHLRYFLRFYILAASALLGHGNLERAQEVMRCMVTSFAEIGKLKESVDMIFEMQNQGLTLSIHTFNWVLRVAVSLDHIEFAEKLFAKIPHYSVSLNCCSFKIMINAYSKNGSCRDIERLLKEMLERGFSVDNATCTIIVDALCEIGLSSKVPGVFEKMSNLGVSPNVINYTALINQLCKRGNVKLAFQMLEKMVEKGMNPNVYTHTTLIHGLCRIGWTEKAFRLFLKLVRSDSYKPNVYTYTAMIGGYCKENKMNRAEMLLSRMLEQGLTPNVTTYTTIIDGHCKDGNLERALLLMDQMNIEGCLPVICTYNTIVYALLKKRQVQDAYSLLEMAFRNGLRPDKITYTILISEHCKQERNIYALDLLYQMFKFGFVPDIFTYTVLISAFCKQGKMEDSIKLFDEALKVGLIPTKQTFTSMISGFCKAANLSTALDMLEKMSSYGCVADSFTYCALISGLCKDCRLQEAHALYDSMIDDGLIPCEVTRVTLAFEYCKINDYSVAMAILNRLDNKLWIRTANILVRKLSSIGQVDPATIFVHKLLDKEKKIDYITYIAFVNACYGNDKYSIVSDLSERISLLAQNITNHENYIL